MAKDLAEDKQRRRIAPAYGSGWHGQKYIRWFKVPPGDVEYHQTHELTPGAVLPEKWGGVATSKAIDPRLTATVEQKDRAGSLAVLYTEWTALDTISGFVSDFWTPYELTGSGGRVGSDQRFYGERTCCILNSEVGSLAGQYNPALGAYHVFPGSTGILPAGLKRYRLRPMAERPQCSLLTMYYEEPTPIEALEPGRAVLQVRVSSSEKKKKYDDELKPIEAYDDTDAGYKWVLVSGDNVVLEPGCIVRIQTVSSIADKAPKAMSLIGRLNFNTFTNIGNAPPGTMQFRGEVMTGELIGRKYWSKAFEFEYRPLNADGTPAFNGSLTVKKYKRQAKTIPVLNENNEQDGSKTSRVTVWAPQDGTENRNIAPQWANFAELDGWLSWL